MKAQGPTQPDGVRLAYDTPLVVVGGGTVSLESLRDIARPGYGLVGADSGGDALADAGLVPDAVIGDFDSVADAARFGPETGLLAFPEQDSTDFEKVLSVTEAPLTLAVGMTGGRFDHMLAALHAVTRFARARRIVLVDETDIAIGLVGGISLAVGAGTRVSVYPLGRTAFSCSEGLLYALDGLVMEQGRLIGTSNRAVADIITIAVEEGEDTPWLLILPRAKLDAVIAQSLV